MTKAYDGDYEFEFAHQFGWEFRSAGLSIKTEEFLGIAKTFRTNIEQIASLGALPLDLLDFAQIAHQSWFMARYKMGLVPDDYSEDENPLLKERVQQVLSKIVESRKNSREPGRRICSEQLRTYLKGERDHSERHITAGIEAALAAMISGAYAAFETLAEDLWVAVVDRHPNLAKRFPNKTLTTNDIFQYGPDISKSMGSAYRQKMGFRTLNGIVDTYKTTFGALIAPVFHDSTEIYKTEKIRHLIAHRSGIVDDKFLNEMKRFPEFQNLATLQRLPIDGPMVRQRIDACVNIGTDLITKVDKWSADASRIS